MSLLSSEYSVCGMVRPQDALWVCDLEFLRPLKAGRRRPVLSITESTAAVSIAAVFIQGKIYALGIFLDSR